MVRLLAARDSWVELKVLGTSHLTPKGETVTHIKYKKLFTKYKRWFYLCSSKIPSKFCGRNASRCYIFWEGS